MESCEPCNYYDFSSNEQFENAENCVNCEQPQPACPPQCMECCAPPCEPVGGHNQQEKQGCYESWYPSEDCPPGCFDPCEPSPPRSACPSVYDACGPCIPRTPCQPRYDPCMPMCPPNCNPCCDPCEPLGPCPMPGEESREQRCPPPCSPICAPYVRRRYIQPARRESCKPVVSYERPCIPMTSDTVYKKSFDFIDAQTAASCRMPPVMPTGQLRNACGEFSKETVTKVKIPKHPEMVESVTFFHSCHSNRIAAQNAHVPSTRTRHHFSAKDQCRV